MVSKPRTATHTHVLCASLFPAQNRGPQNRRRSSEPSIACERSVGRRHMRSGAAGLASIWYRLLTSAVLTTNQRARLMQVDNDTESAESNFAAVLAAREKCSIMRSLAGQHWPQSFASIRMLGLKPSRASPTMLCVSVEHASHRRPCSCSVVCLHRVCEAGT